MSTGTEITKADLENLPETFNGYSTKELVDILNMRMSHQPLYGVPKNKIAAMCELNRQYRLSPIMKA